MKNFLKSNTFYAIVSIVVAILLWVYVVYEVRPTYEMWIKDVPVSCTNVSRLFDEGSLQISGDNQSLINGGVTVDIKVRGDRGRVSSVDAYDISCTLNMITVDKAGSYSLKPDVETSIPGITISQIDPSAIRFSVDSIMQSDVDVELITTGELPEGFEIENLKAKTDKVKITGPKNLVDSVKRAYIELDCSSLSASDTEKSLLIVFEGKNGKAVDASLFSKSMEYVKVSFNLYTEKEVTVLLSPKYQDEQRQNRYGQSVVLSCSSKSDKKEGDSVRLKVKLKGSADALEKYLKSEKTVYTEEIDVKDIYADKTFYSVAAAELANNVEYVEVPTVDVQAVVKQEQ